MTAKGAKDWRGTVARKPRSFAPFVSICRPPWCYTPSFRHRFSTCLFHMSTSSSRSDGSTNTVTSGQLVPHDADFKIILRTRIVFPLETYVFLRFLLQQHGCLVIPFPTEHVAVAHSIHFLGKPFSQPVGGTHHAPQHIERSRLEGILQFQLFLFHKLPCMCPHGANASQTASATSCALRHSRVQNTKKQRTMQINVTDWGIRPAAGYELSATGRLPRGEGKKKRVSYLHRTATTFYPCCGQALGEFKGSWSCRTYPWCKSSAFGRIYQISAHISSHFAVITLALSGIGETPEGAARHLATALSRPGASVIRCGFYIFAIPKKQAF